MSDLWVCRKLRECSKRNKLKNKQNTFFYKKNIEL